MLAVPTSTPQAGDRPSPEERAKIESVLRSMGFVRWDDIEREEGGRVWKVDDARATEGRQYDLRLATDDLRELSRREED
jgi:hypothetical protein